MQSEINVEEIMEKIRQDIAARGLAKDDVSFDNIPINGNKNKLRILLDRIKAFAYFRIFLHTPKQFQSVVKRMAGKE